MDGKYALAVKAGSGTEVSFMVGDTMVVEKGEWMMGGMMGGEGPQGPAGARFGQR